MKILGLISSKNDPASRFRIMQYSRPLQDFGTQLNTIVPYPPKDSDPSRFVLKNKQLWHLCQVTGRLKIVAQQFFYDAVWQNRLLLYDRYTIERLIKKPVVFDFDDAIWLTEGTKQVRQAIASAELIFAGNEYLAEYSSQLNKQTLVIPSTIDTSVFKLLHKKSASFTLGWIGTKSNFAYLDLIKQAILNFLQETKNTRFIIVSTEAPDTFKFDNDRIIFKKWEADNENQLINEFDIGLMPLADNEWTKGKCGYKMLQYMACGKPFIASPVGINQKIIADSNAGLAATDENSWLKAFHQLYNDNSFFESCSIKGRPYVENSFSVDKWTPIINEHLKKLTPSS